MLLKEHIDFDIQGHSGLTLKKLKISAHKPQGSVVIIPIHTISISI